MTKVTATKTKNVGRGRPKGSTNKINGEKILLAVAQQCGKPFEQLIAQVIRHKELVGLNFALFLMFHKPKLLEQLQHH